MDEKEWYHLPGLYEEKHAYHLSNVDVVGLASDA